MQDGAELAEAVLRRDPDDPRAVDEALDAYEAAAVPRAAEAAAGSAANLDIAFRRADAPRGLVDLMVVYTGGSGR
jgi:2-polyprenyl-6-methoxyphenol hydroxylase-like FAD-dependent oxidoreductase